MIKYKGKSIYKDGNKLGRKKVQAILYNQTILQRAERFRKRYGGKITFQLPPDSSQGILEEFNQLHKNLIHKRTGSTGTVTEVKGTNIDRVDTCRLRGMSTSFQVMDSFSYIKAKEVK